MTVPILRFDEKFKFLSNFFLCAVLWEGLHYPSSEHAYQAAKCANLSDRLAFTDPNMSAGTAKWLGREVAIRSDWEDVKVEVMMDILRCKFTQNTWLRDALCATNDALLVEGNHWHDQFWGNCTCNRLTKCRPEGKNQLGKLLMVLRDELSE